MIRAALVLVAAISALAVGSPPAVQTWQLGAGTTVALVEDHRAPLVDLVLEFPAGTWCPWARRVHAEEAVEILLHDPAGKLRARADRLAADVRVGMGERSSHLRAAFLKRDFQEVAALIREIVSNRDFDRRELARSSKQRDLAWKSALKDPFFRRDQALARILFASGDPRRQSVEKPQRFETSAERLAGARDALVRLPRRIIAFAGDLTREEAEPLAESLLPTTDPVDPPGLEPDLLPLADAASRPREVTVPLPRLTQVYLAYGREGLPVTDPDYPAFLVADHALGGNFYSRLSVALRHEGGETYGASTSGSRDVVARPYALETYTRVANAAVAERKLRDVLRVFREKGITEDERAAAVGFLEGRLAFGRQAPAQILGRFREETSLGLPPGYLDGLVARASRLTLDEINGFITRWFEPSRFSMVRVAPGK